MEVTVKLVASLQLNRFREAKLELPESCRIEHLLTELGIVQDDLGLIMVNGKVTTLDTELRAGVSITLFPVVGGG